MIESVVERGVWVLMLLGMSGIVLMSIQAYLCIVAPILKLTNTANRVSECAMTLSDAARGDREALPEVVETNAIILMQAAEDMAELLEGKTYRRKRGSDFDSTDPFDGTRKEISASDVIPLGD